MVFAHNIIIVAEREKQQQINLITCLETLGVKTNKVKTYEMVIGGEKPRDITIDNTSIALRISRK